MARCCNHVEMPFTGFQDKHDEEPYFTPSDWADWRRGQGDLDGFVCPESVVLVYDNRTYRSLSEAPVAQPVGGRAMAALVALGRTNGRVGVLGGFGYSAPVAVGRMENLIALGVRRFVSLGSAGGLQPDLEVGDLVVCTGAVRDEGVSHHYLPDHAEVSPDPTLTAALSAKLSGHGGPIKAGRTWTIDAPYRETVAEVHHYRADGVLTVEMEAAALFAVAAVRGVAIASAFCISDLLHRHEWHPDFNSPKLLEGLSALGDAAVSTLEVRRGIGLHNQGRRRPLLPRPGVHRSTPSGQSTHSDPSQPLLPLIGWPPYCWRRVNEVKGEVATPF